MRCREAWLSFWAGSRCSISWDFRFAGFDANVWWIDLRFLPEEIGNSFLFLSALCLLGFGFRPALSFWRRCLTQGLVGLRDGWEDALGRLWDGSTANKPR
jgi:hypothetical protein